ncbi:flagellar protein FlaG [Marinobacter daepoensis]|uniref:Flagellar protein FlaG n=1 Tax=Marinobacter daepoensis TaxID=262077 RepID=A0ABS3BHK0_9GAMM|nr:flagellar protein FlaG [Marinobacter daepoensis]MBN7771308.1 flagellar protein FlaG [Marinobacter daepoensis]MBY6079170.1 flagellar protein FlaG [Marinobacter daepoensis]
MNDVNLNSPQLKLVQSTGQSTAGRDAEGNASPSRTSSVSSQSGVAVSGRVDTTNDLMAPFASKAVEVSTLGEAVSQLNDYVQSVSRDLQFEVDSDLGQTVVKVVDQETQEVIRQIPDEVALRLAEKLQQDEPLTLFNIKV